MDSNRIKELQEETAYPQSISVYKALMQVWNECQQEHNEQLRIANVVKSFTAEDVVNELEDSDHLDDAIQYFKEQIHKTKISGSGSLPKQKRVMFKFDDDEPMHLNSIFEGGEFIIKLKEGKIKFEKDGKSFELYVE